MAYGGLSVIPVNYLLQKHIPFNKSLEKVEPRSYGDEETEHSLFLKWNWSICKETLLVFVIWTTLVKQHSATGITQEKGVQIYNKYAEAKRQRSFDSLTNKYKALEKKELAGGKEIKRLLEESDKDWLQFAARLKNQYSEKPWRRNEVKIHRYLFEWSNEETILVFVIWSTLVMQYEYTWVDEKKGEQIYNSFAKRKRNFSSLREKFGTTNVKEVEELVKESRHNWIAFARELVNKYCEAPMKDLVEIPSFLNNPLIDVWDNARNDAWYADAWNNARKALDEVLPIDRLFD